jgi:hypothetical protein
LFTGLKHPQDLGDFVEHAIIDVTGHSETTFRIGWGSGYPALHTVPVTNVNPYFEHTSQVNFKDKDLSHHWSRETDYTADCHNGSLYICAESIDWQ